MKKAQLLKHLQQVAETATTRKRLNGVHVRAITEELFDRLNGVHVRAITEELFDVWARSLQETGSASLKGFGRFDVSKSTGRIMFTPSKLWKDKIDGDVSSSRGIFEDEDEDDEDVDRRM
ncbi:hypothetical protein P43SY_005985 [Pythium insidiosum]|uniref:Uncharacterized protein n=1 Tax=Pythium insidiosum TaxID=114742 RepID=A0AAD5L784_PYTIN|nr:hypothetical protein P43SY_005985 [Pythium insidiosum]